MSGKKKIPGIGTKNNAFDLPPSPSSPNLLSATSPRSSSPSGLQGLFSKPSKWFSRAPSASKQQQQQSTSTPSQEPRPRPSTSSSRRPTISGPSDPRHYPTLNVPGTGLSGSQSVVDLSLQPSHESLVEEERESGELNAASRKPWSRSVDDLSSFTSGGPSPDTTPKRMNKLNIEEYRNPPVPFPSLNTEQSLLTTSPSLPAPSSPSRLQSPAFQLLVQSAPSEDETPIPKSHVRAKSQGAHHPERVKVPAVIPLPSPPRRRPSADSQDPRQRVSSDKEKQAGGFGSLGFPFHFGAGQKVSTPPTSPMDSPQLSSNKHGLPFTGPNAVVRIMEPKRDPSSRSSQIIHCSGFVSRFTLSSKFSSQGLAVDKNWKPFKAQLQGTKLYFFKPPADRVGEIRELFLTGPTPVLPEIESKSSLDPEYGSGESGVHGRQRSTEDGKRKRAYWGRAQHADLCISEDKTPKSGTSDALIHETIFATTFQRESDPTNEIPISERLLTEPDEVRWRQFATAILLCLPARITKASFETELIRDLDSFKRGATDTELQNQRSRLKWLVYKYINLHGAAAKEGEWQALLEEYDEADPCSSSGSPTVRGSRTIILSDPSPQRGGSLSTSTSAPLLSAQTRPPPARGLSTDSIDRSRLANVLTCEGLSRETFARTEMRKVADSLTEFARSQLDGPIQTADFLVDGETGNSLSAYAGSDDKPHWLTRIVLDMVLEQVGRAEKRQDDTAVANVAPKSNSSTYVRAGVVSRWVQIGEKCRVAGDECSWRAIMSGLCSVPVVRLEKVWKRVDAAERVTVFDWVSGERSLARGAVTPWAGDLRQKVADAMTAASQENRFVVQPMLDIATLIQRFMDSWQSCKYFFLPPSTPSSDVTALSQYWAARLNDAAPKGCLTIKDAFGLSTIVEPRHRSYFQPFFWRPSSAHPSTHSLMPLLFPEPLPTVSLIDRSALIRVKKESLLGPSPSLIELNEAETRRVTERAWSAPKSQNSGRRNITEPDLGEMLIPCFGGELILKLPLADPKSRPASLVDTLPPPIPPTPPNEEATPLTRGKSIRLSPAGRMERKGSQAKRSRRSSLPSISQRNSLLIPELPVAEATTRVSIKSGTLDRLVDVLVYGLEGVGVVHADDNGEGPLREGKTRAFKVDRVEFSRVWWCGFRSFVTPVVLFELLRKRFLHATQGSKSLSTSRKAGKPAIDSDTNSICLEVLSALRDWITVGGGAQDVLDDPVLLQAFRSFLADAPEPECPEVGKARLSLHKTFVQITSRPFIDTPLTQRSEEAVTPGPRFGTSSADIDAITAADLVDNLDSIAYTVFRGVTEAHMFELADILEAQTADRTGWFIRGDSSELGNDTLCIQDLYNYLQAVEVSPSMSEDGTPLHKLFNPSLRSVIRAHNSIRDWAVTKISNPSLTTSVRVTRMELLVEAIKICRDKAILGDPNILSRSEAQPANRSFVEAALVSAILAPESRAYTRSWNEVAAKREGSLSDLVGLLGPMNGRGTDSKPLTVDLAWIIERMMEVLTLPDVLESEDTQDAINLDKRRYLHNLIVNAAGLTPRIKRATEAERHDMERLTAMGRESQQVLCDMRSIREVAQREMNHMSLPPTGRRLVKPFHLIVTLQHEKSKRDRYMREKLLKEKRMEQLRSDKRVSQINKAMQQKPLPPGQKHLRQKKSMSGMFPFFRPLSVAFGASTDKLSVMVGRPRSAAELDFPVSRVKVASSINLVGAGVRNFINDERPYTLQLDSDDGGHFILQALSLADRDRWLSTLKKVAETSAMKRLTYLGRQAPPQLNEVSDFSGHAPADPSGIFGLDLISLLRRESPSGQYTAGVLPRLVQMCIAEVEKRGLTEPGIYRIAGSKTVCNALRDDFNRGGPIDMSLEGNYPDIHVVGDVIRQWFRELPETIFTTALYDNFLDAIKIRDYEERKTQLRTLIWQLPSANFDVLQALFEHLDHVVDFEEHNHMSPDALAVVFNPSLCKTALSAFGNMQFTLALVKNCIIHYHYLFSQQEPEADGDMEQDGQGDDRSTDSGGSPSLDTTIANGGFPETLRNGVGLEPSGTDSSFMSLDHLP
ncbi:rho GTPase-activating protein [Tulasnella sp. JGI-2019a]|nr:rho GTPase-activating protein [Tulasnella sp. JGI-2019a]